MAIHLRMGRHPHLITDTFALQRLNVSAKFGSAKDTLDRPVADAELVSSLTASARP